MLTTITECRVHFQGVRGYLVAAFTVHTQVKCSLVLVSRAGVHPSSKTVFKFSKGQVA